MSDESRRGRGDRQTADTPGATRAQVREATEAADEQMEDVVETVEQKVAETLHRRG